MGGHDISWSDFLQCRNSGRNDGLEKTAGHYYLYNQIGINLPTPRHNITSSPMASKTEEASATSPTETMVATPVY